VVVAGVAAQNDDEPFDLYTPEGAPLGRSKARRDVHRDGDWHRSLHLWVWGRIDGVAHLVFQRRSLEKDTWPGALDVAVTGHARAGETIEATLREAEEEIGLAVRAEDVVCLGLRRREERRALVHDNELQDIFARVHPADLLALRPDPAEVSGLLMVPFRDAEAVLCEGRSTAAKRLVWGERPELVAEDVSTSEFVPAKDEYYRKACESMRVVLAGGTPARWTLG
jgi:isopentenyldiphosphate isomerase